MKSLISTALSILAISWSLGAQGYRVAVLPVEFSDIGFEDKAADVDNKVNRAQVYFNDQFHPHRNFSFELLPTVRLPRNMAWYGSNTTSGKDERIGSAVREACTQSGGSFSVYDNDGDGYIDIVCLITAGGSEAEGDGVFCIWPQQGYMHDRGGTFSIGGKTVDCFMVCPGKSGLGTFCHEFAHHFGLQDLYDTDNNGSGGTTKGVWGSVSLMDRGLENNGGDTPPNFCAIELEQLGIGNPVEAGEGVITLRPVSRSKEYLRLESDVPDEYFLLECRDRSGWDAFSGGAGLLVYHIDRSSNNSWYSDYYRRNLSASERWQNNQVNCRPDHQCARIVEAVPNSASLETVFFPQEGRTSLASDTDPAFRFWSGTTSSQAVCGIEKLSDGSIRFRIITPISIEDNSVFQDAAILNWSTDPSLSVKECQVSWSTVSSQSGSGSATVQPTEEGRFSLIIEGLSPATSYRTVIKAVCQDGAVYSETVSFTTKSSQKGVRPFIYLNVEGRLPDGSFQTGSKLPLRVYNAQEALKVEWYFDEEKISADASGFWRPLRSGTLKARVYYEDGSTDVIIKQIRVAHE